MAHCVKMAHCVNGIIMSYYYSMVFSSKYKMVVNVYNENFIFYDNDHNHVHANKLCTKDNNGNFKVFAHFRFGINANIRQISKYNYKCFNYFVKNHNTSCQYYCISANCILPPNIYLS